MNTYLKQRELLLTPFGYKTELKLKSNSDFILFPDGFKQYSKTSIDFFNKYYKFSTVFSDYYLPHGILTLGRKAYDFSNDFISTDLSTTELNKLDYLYLPKCDLTNKKYIKNFSIKKYSLNGFDFSSSSPNIKYFNILHKNYLNKYVTEEQLDQVKKYYKTDDLDLLYKSLILISSSPIKTLPVNDVFITLVVLSLTGKYLINGTTLTLLEIEKEQSILFNEYFNNIYSKLYKNTNTHYDAKTKKYILNSHIFTEIFKNHFDSYSFLNNISPALFKVLKQQLNTLNYLHVPSMYSALNLQFIYYKNNILINVIKNEIDGTYLIDFDTQDYYISFKDGFLLTILNKEEFSEEFFTTFLPLEV